MACRGHICNKVRLLRTNKSQTSIIRFVSLATSYDDVINSQNTRITSLRNKLKVASEPSYKKSATVGIWVDIGPQYESSKNNGLTHLLEHMLFKGTSKYSGLDLEKEAGKHGLMLSSHLSRDHLAIYAKCLSKDIPKAVELLSDMLLNSTLLDADIQNEKKEILAEMKSDETDLAKVVMDYLHATAFQGSALAKPIIGTTNSVNNLSRADLASYVKTYIKPTRVVLAAAGGVDHDQLVNVADKHLSSLSLNYEDQVPHPAHNVFTGSEIRARYDDENLCHIAMAVEGCGLSSADHLPLLISRELIGGWDASHGCGVHAGSHLAEICAKTGYAHSFQSFSINYKDTGLWGAYFVCDRHTIEDFIFNLQKEWMRICTSATDFEVERAKNQLRSKLFGHVYDSTLTCDQLAKQVLHVGRRITMEELETRLEGIGGLTVRDVSFKYLYDKCPALVSYGPTEQVPDYNRIRSGMYWLRY